MPDPEDIITEEQDLPPDEQADEQTAEFADDDVEGVQTTLAADEDGLEHLQILIRRPKSDRRLDKYLAGRLGRDHSRTSLQGYIREGNVTVNDKIVKPRYTLRSGDVIDMMLPIVKRREIPPEPIPLDVIYEDDDLMAVNKQSGLIVHPARGNWTGTLVNALAYYFQKNWRDISELPTSGEAFRPGIVHRLDRDTTGIMLVAKSEQALWRLGWQFEHRKVHKTYTAIVHGRMSMNEDLIDAPIGKHARIREKYAVHRLTGRPLPVTIKPAVTRYKVLERLAAGPGGTMPFTLVELYPQTGRTHQLRVHMSYIGHPIVGDRMYGGGPLYMSQLDGHAEVADGPLITRQALHAHTIAFTHPRTREPMEFTAPWPKDFTDTLNELQRRSERV
ncbi:MAG: RluA family pseudouridine synthase [Planctomycetaceae bacterium]|nr:RluA family pseudouridine synthase [Planctomycetaceae bacterium]